MLDKKQQQDAQYAFPYHHIVNLMEYNNIKIFHWGLEYFCYINEIIRIVLSINPSKLLDVGCGDGAFDIALSKIQPTIQITACDFSERPIALAKAIGYDTKIEFVHKNINEINDLYDAITCIETLEHIPNDEMNQFIQDLINRLNVGGYLIISVPTTNKKLHAKHFRHYDQELIDSTFKDTKLKLVENLFIYKISFFGKLLQKLSNKLGTFNCIQKMCLFITKHLIFHASEKNAAHIVSLYQKT